MLSTIHGQNETSPHEEHRNPGQGDVILRRIESILIELVRCGPFDGCSDLRTWMAACRWLDATLMGRARGLVAYPVKLSFLEN